MVASKGAVAIVGEWGSVSNCDLASRVKHAYFYAQQCRLHSMVPVWWDDGGLAGNGFGLLNRKASPLSWQFPTVVAALVAGANAANFGTEVAPSNEIKNSLSSGLLVKAGIITYALHKSSLVSLRLFDMQGKVMTDLVKSNQSAGNYEVKLPTKGISSGNYILEFKAGNNFLTKRVNVL